jgi:thioredoxin-dependent peroxiredoxin
LDEERRIDGLLITLHGNKTNKTHQPCCLEQFGSCVVILKKEMATTLTVGSKAPAFKGLDQDGEKIALSDFKGKKLVVYFYPQDNTPTCTNQACSIRDGWKDLKKAGIDVIGVSTDDAKSHKKFEAKFKLPFRMVADTEHVMSEQFGVWAWKKFMGREYIGMHRTTFLIDEKAKIVHIIEKPDSKNHAAEILAAWKALG